MTDRPAPHPPADARPTGAGSNGGRRGPTMAGLEAERATLRRIRAVHARHLETARSTAERLAAEAAEATEDGIRDLYDPDAEADTAIAAAMVRQMSDRAMHAARRVTELEAMGQALAFGHTVDGDGKRVDVGRLSVIEGDEALLVDWRADAAVPFYRATPLDRLGIAHRRHLLYGEAVAELESYSDEVFDVDWFDRDGIEPTIALRGEAALLASVSAPTRAQMRSVVATIQAEQDAVIRAAANKPLVVQGGPGTGKTVVALHRAAYLLYDQRVDLSEQGVLVVGPTAEFLTYIRGVLPSLGETGVVSVTVAKLFPGILLGLDDVPDVAELKGRSEMVPFLAAAVADRRRRPRHDLVVYYGSRRVVLPRDRLRSVFDVAGRHTTYNEGARAFREGVIGALSAEVYNPAFDGQEDADEAFATSVDVTRFLLRHWPPLRAEQALNDLLGSAALLRSAADASGLAAAEAVSLFRPRTSEADLATIRWSDADVPLLDELEWLLGPVEVDDDVRDVERDEADEFELAAADDSSADGDDADADADAGEGSGPLGGRTDADLDAISLDDPIFGERIYYESVGSGDASAGAVVDGFDDGARYDPVDGSIGDPTGGDDR